MPIHPPTHPPACQPPITHHPGPCCVPPRGGVHRPPLQAVQSLIYGDQAPNLASYFSTCSNGQVSLSPANTLVQAVDIPCVGTGTGGQAFSSTDCSNYNPYGWFDYAEQQSLVSLAPFNRRVLILPAGQQAWMGANCAWAGLGSEGIEDGQYGLVWLSGEARHHCTTITTTLPQGRTRLGEIRGPRAHAGA